MPATSQPPLPRLPRRSRTSRLLGASTLAVALLGATACAGGSGTDSTAGATTASAGSSTSTTSPSATTASPATSASSTTSTTATPTRTPSCAERLAADLTASQRVGQLLMVGLQPTGSSRTLAQQVARDHLGGVIYLGGWQGSGTVKEVSTRLQRATQGSPKATGGIGLLVAADQEGGAVQQLKGAGFSSIPSARTQATQASPKATAGIGLLVAADQEGGAVQQLKGAGFSSIPSARTQATWGAGALQKSVRTWSRELGRAGVNVNLSPVADTVPTSLGAANDPIGRHRRDFVPGDAEANGRYAAAFVRGSLAADVAPTVKHFPGLGRVTGNTDLTASGTTDTTATRSDPYLAPFRDGIRAGAPLVMVSSARYPKLDPDNRAMFSKAIVNGLLRERLGFDGVVITDDVGAAKAVQSVPVGQRATRFIAAGGDIVLTADASQAPAMRAAVLSRMKASPAFAKQVDASVVRVLALKTRLGLASCGG